MHCLVSTQTAASNASQAEVAAIIMNSPGSLLPFHCSFSFLSRTEEMPFISEFKTSNREMTLIPIVVLTHLPMSKLVTAKSPRRSPAWITATTISLYQQLHAATDLTFNNSTFTFPLAGLSLGSEREERAIKSRQ